MCGIFGIVNFGGKSPLAQKKVMKKDQFAELIYDLLIRNESYGSDASGLLHIGTDWDKIRIFKRPYRASEIVDSVDYKRFVNEIEPISQIVLGHTRAKTVGTANNNMNNHPVVYGSVAGVHNGSIAGADWIFRDEGLPRKAEVDTEALMAIVDKYINNIDRFHKKDEMEDILSGLGWIAALMVSAKKPNILMVMVTNGSLSVTWLEDYQMAIFSTSSSDIKAAVKGINATIGGKYTAPETESVDNQKFTLYNVPSSVVSSPTLPFPRVNLELKGTKGRKDPLSHFMGV